MILVTGGTGLVGACLLADLLQEGAQVRALKRPSSSIALFESWAKSVSVSSANLAWVEGDLLDPESLSRALDGVDTVYHCAAVISSDPKDVKEMEQINIQGTANLVNLCIDKKDLKIFCHVSSVATLGRNAEIQQIDENIHWVPGNHNSNYSVSKYGAEREVWRAIAEGLPAVMVNPSIILGPGHRSQGSGALFDKVWKGFPFYSDGMSGFVDVRDVSAAMRMLVSKGITGERYILNGGNLSFKELFQKIAIAFGVKAPSIKVRKWQSAVIWRLESLRSAITGKRPFITKESARSSQQVYRYSAAKMESLGFHFRRLDDTINFVSDKFKERF
ncbi:NAD-dependent epimerase/dehydratase family protein [soil metagenome]